MKYVVYIDRNYLYFYGGAIRTVLPLQFLATTVKDMELINFDALGKQIEVLIKNNKIPPDDIGIIIAHQSSFEKLIPAKTLGPQLEQEKKQFLENVPFEDIMYKGFTTPAGTKLVAVNKELVYAIKDIFIHHGFRTAMIASITSLYPDTDVQYNATIAAQILKKSSQLSQYSFPLVDIEVVNTDTYDESNKPIKNNNRLFLLIGVFIILIGSLAGVLLLQKPAEKKTKKLTSTALPIIQLSPTQPVASVSASITVTASRSPSISQITIQILNGSGVAGQADELKTQIEDAGYTNISTGNAPTVQSTKSIIVFKPAVPETVRQEIINLVSELIGDVIVQDNTQISGDVIITTAQTESNLPSPTP